MPVEELMSDDNRPEVGVGSPRWFENLRRDHVAAAAVGGFFGHLFGEIIDRGPTCFISAQRDLVISYRGITITVDRKHIRHVDRAIHDGELGFHLWTRDTEAEEMT
jgi:hypothetical protein